MDVVKNGCGGEESCEDEEGRGVEDGDEAEEAITGSFASLAECSDIGMSSASLVVVVVGRSGGEGDGEE